MTKRFVTTSAAVGVTTLALLAPAFAADAPKVGPPPPKLFGVVNAKGTVVLKDSKGKVVTSLRRGSYTVTIQDLSRTDVFRINGPGVSKTTGRKFIGAAIWGVTLKRGTYTIQGTSAKSKRTFVVTR